MAVGWRVSGFWYGPRLGPPWEFGQNQGHIQAVLDVGFARGAFLARMRRVGYGIGFFKQGAIAGRRAGRQCVEQSLKFHGQKYNMRTLCYLLTAADDLALMLHL